METRQQRFMYDERLSPMTRIFLAEVSKYFGTPADCLNDNLYFATIFKVSTRQVKRWKEEAAKFGYLEYGQTATGKKTLEYVPDVENHNNKCENGEMQVVYRTASGQFLVNSLEAVNYYNSYIDSFDQFPEKLKGLIRIFCSTFANSLFNEKIFNIKIESTGAILTTEFLQYIVEHFTIRLAYRTIQAVMKNYTKIDNLDLYVLASISKLYWAEFQIAKNLPEYKQKHKEDLKLFLEEAEKHFKGDKA